MYTLRHLSAAGPDTTIDFRGSFDIKGLLGDFTVGVYSAGPQAWFGIDTKVISSSGALITAGRQYWRNWKDLADELGVQDVLMMSVPTIIALGDAAIPL